MSMGRCFRFAGIVFIGASLSPMEGLAQHRQPVGEMTAASAGRQLEFQDQAKGIIRYVPENGFRAMAAAASVTDEPAVASEARTEPEASPARFEPMPEALFLPDANHLSPLETAYLDAYSILRRENSCSRFYGGARVIEVLNELKKQLKGTYMDSVVAVRMSGVTTSVTSLKYGISYRLFEKAELNLRGSFYKSNTFRHDETVPAVGGFSPNTREARVTILLHELGHLVEKSHKFLLPNDGNDVFASHNNTNKILEVCGQQIRQLSSTSFTAELEAARPSSTASAIQANLQQ